MWRPARLFWPTSLAVLVLAAAAWTADPGDPKRVPATGRSQSLPGPQDIDPARVDLEEGFRAHQIGELQQALDRVEQQIAALQQLLRDLQQERAKELQHAKEVKERIVRELNLPGPDNLSPLQSDLKQTEDRIARIDLRIAATNEKLDARKVEKRGLREEIRDAKRRQRREQRDGPREADPSPEGTTQTPSPVRREAN